MSAAARRPSTPLIARRSRRSRRATCAYPTGRTLAACWPACVCRTCFCPTCGTSAGRRSCSARASPRRRACCRSAGAAGWRRRRRPINHSGARAAAAAAAAAAARVRRRRSFFPHLRRALRPSISPFLLAPHSSIRSVRSTAAAAILPYRTRKPYAHAAVVALALGTVLMIFLIFPIFIYADKWKNLDCPAIASF